MAELVCGAGNGSSLLLLSCPSSLPASLSKCQRRNVDETGITWFFLPDTPMDARWATHEEKVQFVERVRSNNQGSREKHFNKNQAIEAFTDPFTWLLFFLAVFNTLVVGGLGTFNNLLINQAFGFDVLTSQLLGIPLSVGAVCFYLLFASVV